MRALVGAGGVAAGQSGGQWIDAVRGHAGSEAAAGLVNELGVEAINVDDDEKMRRYIAGVMARLQEVWVGRQIAEVKSKLQRTSPVEQGDEYHAMFGDLVAMEAYRRSLLERDIVGQLHQTLGIDQQRFGITADRSGVRDPVARLQARHIRADGFDDAGTFGSGRERQRLRIKPGPVVYVDIVQPDRLVPHQRLARLGIGQRHLLPHHLLGAAVLMDANGVVHRRGSLASSGGIRACRRLRCSRSSR